MHLTASIPIIIILLLLLITARHLEASHILIFHWKNVTAAVNLRYAKQNWWKTSFCQFQVHKPWWFTLSDAFLIARKKMQVNIWLLEKHSTSKTVLVENRVLIWLIQFLHHLIKVFHHLNEISWVLFGSLLWSIFSDCYRSLKKPHSCLCYCWFCCIFKPTNRQCCLSRIRW